MLKLLLVIESQCTIFHFTLICEIELDQECVCCLCLYCQQRFDLWGGDSSKEMLEVVRNMTLLFLLRYPGVNLWETFFWNNSFVSYVTDSPWETIRDGLHFFRCSIITTWELLTWILAHDRGERIPTLPRRIPRFTEKEQNTNEAKQLFGAYIETYMPENWNKFRKQASHVLLFKWMFCVW